MEFIIDFIGRLAVLINAVIDPTAGTESGHIQSLNPKSAVAQKK
jgi:hypothetical protein